MLERVLYCFALLAVLTGCSSKTPEIDIVCERDDIGNYILKWETDPVITGIVKILVSDTPNSFSGSRAMFVKTEDQVTTYITNNNVTRLYFQLCFNNKYKRVVSERMLNTTDIQNLRDVGGYYTANQRMLRWGMLFRSGQMIRTSVHDSLLMKELKLKTIVDLRAASEQQRIPLAYNAENMVSIPINAGQPMDAYRRMRNGQMKKGDGMVYMQDVYLKYVTENTEQFARFFQLLLDEDNYPLLFNSSLGKDRVGFLTSLIMRVLNILPDEIEADYRATDRYLVKERMGYLVRGLNYDAQETLTLLLSTDLSWMDLAYNQIDKEYGSFHEYVANGLKLSEKDIRHLKEILLR